MEELGGEGIAGGKKYGLHNPRPQSSGLLHLGRGPVNIASQHGVIEGSHRRGLGHSERGLHRQRLPLNAMPKAEGRYQCQWPVA